MQFTPKQLSNSLVTAFTQRETYFAIMHRPDDLVVSVNKLLEIVRNTHRKQINLTFLEDSYKDHHIYSFMLSNNDSMSYDICLLGGMSNCWNRFALCKELFHAIMDEEEVRNTSIFSHLRDFKMSMTDASVSGGASSINEMLTEYAAMQFLFPYQKRLTCVDEVKTRAASGEAKKDIYMDIATRFRIPRVLVEDYLDDGMIGLFSVISWDGKSDVR